MATNCHSHTGPGHSHGSSAAQRRGPGDPDLQGLPLPLERASQPRRDVDPFPPSATDAADAALTSGWEVGTVSGSALGAWWRVLLGGGRGGGLAQGQSSLRALRNKRFLELCSDCFKSMV